MIIPTRRPHTHQYAICIGSSIDGEDLPQLELYCSNWTWECMLQDAPCQSMITQNRSSEAKSNELIMLNRLNECYRVNRCNPSSHIVMKYEVIRKQRGCCNRLNITYGQVS